MTKSKRQLRAEAVERLKKVHYHSPMNMLGAILGRTGIGREEDTLDLIDLLADDERPEGDALEKLRKLAEDGRRRYAGRSVGEYPFFLEVGELVDQIERPAELRARVDELTAERDEWKAKCEAADDGAKRGMTNLEWLFSNKPRALLDAVDCMVRGMACNECEMHLYNAQRGCDCEGCSVEWLMAEHAGDCGQIADMSQMSGDCVRAGGEMSERAQRVDEARGISENLGLSQNSGMDTRERLEADVIKYQWHEGYLCSLDTIVDWLDWQAAITERESHCRIEDLSRDCEMWRDRSEDMRMERDGLQAKVGALEAERDHWQRVAGRNGEKLGKLRKALEHDKRMRAGGLPDGIAWPRFEDGALVRFGDEALFNGEVREVCSVTFYRTMEGAGMSVNSSADYRMGQPLKRPVLASDGQPIIIGQTLYGLSDGKAWEVTGLDRGKPHSVEAIEGEVPPIVAKARNLKPEWLTHEKPDSLESIAETVRGWRMFDPDAPAVMVHAHALDDLARRIGEMAKEGAHGERGDD